MGGFMDPSIQENKTTGRGYDQQALNWYQDTMKNIPQMKQFDTPLSQQAGTEMSKSIDLNGPMMEKFFQGAMNGQGANSVDSIIGNMNKLYGLDRQKTIGDVKASGIPMNSSAMARTMTGALGRSDLQNSLDTGKFALDARNQDLSQRFQAAMGLGGMPAYYAAPSSVENAMFNMRYPIERGNQQAQMQGLGMGSNLYGNLMSQNFSGVDPYMMPSGFDRYVAPFLNSFLSGAGKGAGESLPFTLGAGG